MSVHIASFLHVFIIIQINDIVSLPCAATAAHSKGLGGSSFESDSEVQQKFEQISLSRNSTSCSSTRAPRIFTCRSLRPTTTNSNCCHLPPSKCARQKVTAQKSQETFRDKAKKKCTCPTCCGFEYKVKKI